MAVPDDMAIPPEVYIAVGESFIARGKSGQMYETVEIDKDGAPDWEHAGMCDERGMGGMEGLKALELAFDAMDDHVESWSAEAKS